jgi:DNA end-binding protein Ku
MPRSIWNGTITFGLVNVPIKLHSATESRTVHFREVHATDGAPLQHKRVCSEEDEEVPYEEIAKGYEVRSGEFVLLSKDEVAAAAGERSKVIDVGEFVEAGDIDPVYFEKTYYLGAREGAEEAYRLLHAALEQTGRAGIGRFTFHNREYLVAIRPLDGVLALHTMRFADEVVELADLEVSEPQKAPSKREVDMAASLVDSLHEPFKPEKQEDTHRAAVLEVVRRKAAGEEISAPEEEDLEPADDLMKALEASLKGAKG